MNRVLLSSVVLAALVGSSTTHSVSAEPEQVTMTLREFLKMYERSKAKETPEEKAPREYSLSSTKYDGEVFIEDGEAQSVAFSARMQVQVHKKKGWIKVPLLSRQVALESATVNGRPAAVVLEGGWYTLATDQKGTLDIRLTFAMNVTNSAGTSSFSYNLIPSGATEVEIAVPAEENLGFTIGNARRVQTRNERGRRVVKATLPPQGALNVQWQRKSRDEANEDGTEAAEQAPRIYSEVYTLASVGDGLLRAQANIQQTILFAGVDTFDVKVPEGMTVLDVKGAGLRDWSLSETGVLTAELNYAAEGTYNLSVELERVIGEDSLEVGAPLVQPLGVERTKGWVGVEARGNIEIGAGEVKGATSVDVRTLPGQILGRTSQPVLLGYKYLVADAQIPLVVSAHDDVDVLVTLLDQAEATTMFTRDGRRLTSVRYEVRNNRRQFLRLKLPYGATLWSSAVAGRAVQPAKSEDDLLIPLIRSRASGGGLASFDVEVVYVESDTPTPRSGKGRFSAYLPTPDVPTTYVGWTVYVPDGAKVNSKKATGTLRYVEELSRPLGAVQALAVESLAPAQRRVAQQQADSGGLGDGAAPVRVQLPLEGEPYFFEKLLALDERLEVRFEYTGLKE